VDRFIETHKFQLGPHIAENVVPSLTVTDTRKIQPSRHLTLLSPVKNDRYLSHNVNQNAAWV